MDKRTFKLIENDIAIDTDGNIAMTSGSDEEMQALERAFTTNAGEWFLNALHGLNYPNIQGKGITDEAIQLEIIQTALQDSRVREIDHIEIERDNPRRTVNILFHGIMHSGGTIAVPFSV